MRIAFILFDRLTALDFIGVYDPLTRLKSMGFVPNLEWDLCALAEPLGDDKGLRLIPTQIGKSLAGYEWVIVPGGFGTRELQRNQDFLEWLRTAADCPLKASVCSGSLLLGAAGFLHGKRATSHPNAFGELASYCGEVCDARIVDEGSVITARGVTAAIDLGLYLTEKHFGHEVKESIRLQMDYPYSFHL
ncbi:MAG: DJ-1/PfpI family protein [Blastocatellia bacterium]|nr:DJ-1/PfpI family protein [Blastocatellia bacterium]